MFRPYQMQTLWPGRDAGCWSTWSFATKGADATSSVLVSAASGSLRALPLPPRRGPTRVSFRAGRGRPFPCLLAFGDGHERVADRQTTCSGVEEAGTGGGREEHGVSPVVWSFRTEDTSVSARMNRRSNAFCRPLRPFLTQGLVAACA